MRIKHMKRWVAAGIAGVALGVTAGPYIYINYITGNAPAPLGLSSQTSSPGSSGSAQAGRWIVTDGSVVGYRVKEILFGQRNEAVGRTSKVTGTVTVQSATIVAATFTVDMTSLRSDENRRDNQFNGRIMQTSQNPAAQFTLTAPIELTTLPTAGEQRTVTVTGDLTLRGVKRSVTANLTGRYTGSAVEVAGSIPITFADYDIPNPSFAAITTEDHGLLELALKFVHE